LTIPAFSQQSGVQQQVSQHIWSRGQMMRPDSAPELDPTAARLQSIHQDATQLSELSTTLQSDLAQLQKGMLAKDLAQNLKKIEKLSKKLRQEVEQ
jgi:hypothetical protein